jgi:hypothetical protein
VLRPISRCLPHLCGHPTVGLPAWQASPNCPRSSRDQPAARIAQSMRKMTEHILSSSSVPRLPNNPTNGHANTFPLAFDQSSAEPSHTLSPSKLCPVPKDRAGCF